VVDGGLGRRIPDRVEKVGLMTSYWIFLGMVAGSSLTHLSYRMWARGADVFRFRTLLHATRALPGGTVLSIGYPSGAREVFVKPGGQDHIRPADAGLGTAMGTVAGELVNAANRVTELYAQHEGRDVPAADVMKALRGSEEA
jgi:hypothetical protein